MPLARGTAVLPTSTRPCRPNSVAPFDVHRNLGDGLRERLKLTEGRYLKRAAALLFRPDPLAFVTGAFVKIGDYAVRCRSKFAFTTTGWCSGIRRCCRRDGRRKRCAAPMSRVPSIPADEARGEKWGEKTAEVRRRIALAMLANPRITNIGGVWRRSRLRSHRLVPWSARGSIRRSGSDAGGGAASAGDCFCGGRSIGREGPHHRISRADLGFQTMKSMGSNPINVRGAVMRLCVCRRIQRQRRTAISGSLLFG